MMDAPPGSYTGYAWHSSEALDAVDVVPGAPVHQGTTVADRMVLAVTLERLVAAEGVGVVPGPLYAEIGRLMWRISSSAVTDCTTFV